MTLTRCSHKHNRLNMDMKTALNILNLDAGVSSDDAKKAYRGLVKKHHPDLVENHPCQKRNAEIKMKEINLAYRYLAPLLMANKPVQEIIEDNSIKHERYEIFSFLSKIFGELLTGLHKKKGNRAFKNKLKKENQLKKTNGKKVRFDDVFKRVYTVSSDGEGRKARKFNRRKPSQKTSPYHGYQKYMALKKKMKSGQSSLNQDISIGRVDKIEPVKPVNPVGKN